jgi:hypothetical protein
VISTEAGGSSEAIPLRDALVVALLAQQQRPGGEWSTDLQKAVAITLPDSIRSLNVYCRVPQKRALRRLCKTEVRAMTGQKDLVGLQSPQRGNLQHKF